MHSQLTFLNVPVELRNQIYSHLFESATVYIRKGVVRIILDDVSLTQTCRQICAETTGYKDGYSILRLPECLFELEGSFQAQLGEARPHTFIMPRKFFLLLDEFGYRFQASEENFRSDFEKELRLQSDWDCPGFVKSTLPRVERLVFVGKSPRDAVNGLYHVQI